MKFRTTSKLQYLELPKLEIGLLERFKFLYAQVFLTNFDIFLI